METPAIVVTRLECTEDGSSKFWEGWVDGLTFNARWGRIGTNGQSKTKDFATAAKAAGELAKLTKEKLGKGYLAVAGADAEAKVEAGAEVETGAEAEAEGEAKAQANGEAKAQANGEAKAQANGEAKAGAKAKGDAKAKGEAKAGAKAEAKAGAEAKGEAKAGAEAKVLVVAPVPEVVAADEAGWIDAEDGYRLRLFDGEVECLNAKGKALASVPPKVKQGEAADKLFALRDYLAAHEAECKATVDHWMLSSLSVPSGLLAEVWADPAWRVALENAIVAPVIDGKVALDDAGLFRGVDAARGLGLVNLDGESVWVAASELLLPHPILLAERDDWRQLATELGIVQTIAQLFRETFVRPTGIAADASALMTWAEGRFEKLNFALGRCRTLGYRVRGGFAVCPVREPSKDLRLVEARYWIGAEYPDEETYTGELLWVDPQEKTIPLAELGPVAISEGIRMAQAIFSARTVSKEADA